MTTLRPATPFESAPAHFGLQPCPHCGAGLMAPETSEFLGAREVRHSWACDDCGHDFRTAIRIDRRMHARRLG